jgi:hypothetical protein
MRDKTGAELANEGIERSYLAARERWKSAAREALFMAAAELPALTADDIWERFPKGLETGNGSALGHIIREALRLGLIEATGEFRHSTRPAMHCRPNPVWRSLVKR